MNWRDSLREAARERGLVGTHKTGPDRHKLLNDRKRAHFARKRASLDGEAAWLGLTPACRTAVSEWAAGTYRGDLNWLDAYLRRSLYAFACNSHDELRAALARIGVGSGDA